MAFLDYARAIVSYFFGWVKLVQNGEVGWMSVDRKTGKYQREQQPILKKLKLLFLFNPLTEWLDTTHLMRLYIHDKSISQDFFVRAHKPGSRPVFAKDDNSKAVVVADSRVVVYETVAESKKLWIKGSDFSITNLVMDKMLGAKFADGPVASFRLSPQDYHRYHSPVTGTIKMFRSMPGDYYQVDPIALMSPVDILTRNARDYVVIETEEFGDVLFVAIGATNVGTVEIHKQYQKPGNKVTKGDELSIFQFGGSSIVVAFEEARIRFDEDLLSLSKRQIMVSVEVGMSLGEATKSRV